RSLPAVCVSECTLTPAGPEPAGEATQTTVASGGSLDQPPDSMSWFLYPVVNVAHFFPGADRLPEPAVGLRVATVRSQPDRSSPASALAAGESRRPVGSLTAIAPRVLQGTRDANRSRNVRSRPAFQLRERGIEVSRADCK